MPEPQQPAPDLHDPASNLFDAFVDTPAYRGRRISGQAIVRLPYALYGPTIVTHFPLFQSEEDREPFAHDSEKDGFDKCKQRFKEQILDKKPIRFPKEELHKYIGKQAVERNKDTAAVKAALIPVWDKALGTLDEIFSSSPEYFVFDARTLISLEINRAAHDIVVDAIDKKPANAIDPKARRRDAALVSAWEPLKEEAFSIVNGMLQILLGQLNTALNDFKDHESSPERERDPEPARARSDDDDLLSKPLARMGGLIAWFNARDFFDEDSPFTGADGRGFKRTDSIGRKLYALDEPLLPLDHEPLIDKYVIWRRGEKNWRYTFCEGSFRYHAALEGIRFDDAARERERSLTDITSFIKRLLSSRDLNRSFPRLDLSIPEKALRADYPFPGRRVSGAQYFVIPAELLVILASRTQKIATCVGLAQESIYDGGLKSATRSTFDICIDRLCKIEEGLKQSKTREVGAELRAAGSFRPRFDSVISKIENAIDRRNCNDAMHAVLEGAAELRSHLRLLHDEVVGVRLQAENAMTKEQDDFYHVFVELSELLWKRIYGGRVIRAGHDDFVASIVIDGRAMYFSNFRPHSSIGFTRTFFIDFKLAPYQRGRLVRRLCEIATYRMSCVKDRHLFDALQDGINQLNKSFTNIVSTVAANGGYWDKAARDRALRLYLRATRFDMDVPEGISACGRAVEGDWRRVKQQVSDIRERRLTGYAQLSDFLERGLAVSVMEITRVADRYEHLMDRINELMSTIRTELSGRESGRQTTLVIATFVASIAALFANIPGVVSQVLPDVELYKFLFHLTSLGLIVGLAIYSAWMVWKALK